MSYIALQCVERKMSFKIGRITCTGSFDVLKQETSTVRSLNTIKCIETFM